MNIKYHISPETGRPNKCHANIRECPVGGDHYDTKEEARAAYEAQHLDKIFDNLQSRKKSGFISKLDSGLTKMENSIGESRSMEKLRDFWHRRKKEISAGLVGAALIGGLVAGGVSYANNNPAAEYQGTATSNSREFQQSYTCGYTKVGETQIPITCYRTRYKAEVEWNGHEESFTFSTEIREGDTIVVRDGIFGTSANLVE